MIKIIADENIPYVREAFSSLGNITTLPGRKITRESLKDAQILLARSITKVNAELLEGTPVKMVATATTGTDHLDEDYLNKKNIHYASALGSNANSVAEYVIAAILFLAHKYHFTLKGKTIAVIGVGNVGSRVVKKAQALGLKVLQNDPPLARKTGDKRFQPLDEVINADIVTLHVPLTFQGEDATFHMANEVFFSKMKKGAFFINTSRGDVVDTKALHSAINSGKLKGVVLDVWENEPDIDISLVDRVDIGTPHIAGYSLDGKVNGTLMIYKAVCKFLKNAYPTEGRWECTWKPHLPVSPHPQLHVESKERQAKESVINSVVKTIYDIKSDDRSLRKIINLDKKRCGEYFDSLRKNYPVRREFFNTNLYCADKELRDIFQGLGFGVDS